MSNPWGMGDPQFCDCQIAQRKERIAELEAQLERERKMLQRWQHERRISGLRLVKGEDSHDQA